MHALSELTCLGLHRPGPQAGPVAEAAYIERLARVHAHLAAESSGAEAAAARARAAACHQRALSLITHTNRSKGFPS